MNQDYDFQMDDLTKKVKSRKAKKLLVQLPEGLKVYSRGIMDELRKKTGAHVALHGGICYGACDIVTVPGYLTLHFGHSQILPDKNVLYVETFSKLDCGPVAELALETVTERRLGLVTTVQHLRELPKVKKILEKAGRKVYIGKGSQRVRYQGQVLGCDFSSALAVKDKVDAFVYLGSGFFHPQGIAHYARKPVYKANPYAYSVEKVDDVRWERDAHLRMAKAYNARDWAFVHSIKPGQDFSKGTEELQKKLESKRKRVYHIIIDEINSEKLDYLPFDAFVILACPRIVLDDWKNYSKPVILPEEVVL